MKTYNIGVVGATGLVGKKFIKLLHEYDFPLGDIKFYASEKSEGVIIEFKNNNYRIERLSECCFNGLDFVFFFTNSNVSKEWVKKAMDSFCYVIDNSSCFRLDSNSNLIIPSVNFNKIKGKLISNPNCSTIQSVIILDSLKHLNVKKVFISTYQSISGSGQKGIDAFLKNELDYYPFNIKDTCVPLIGEVDSTGYSFEELKMINEIRLLLDKADLEIYPTCVRVPVLYCHGVNLVIELEEEFTINDIYNCFNFNSIIRIVDIPNSINSVDSDYVYVGRIRKNGPYLSLYIVADNLRMGAAYNSLFIALKIISNSIAYKN